MGIVVDRQASWLDTRNYSFEPHYVRVDGGRMHYLDVGEGLPIVLIHGWPTWSFEFRAIIRFLSRNFRCIAPDLIGFGLSDKPKEWAYSAAAQGRNIASLLDHLQVDQSLVVGRDFGGPVALSFALENRNRTCGVALMNTWMWDLAKHDPAALRPAKVAEGPLGKAAYLAMNAGPKLIKTMFCDKSKYTESLHDAYFGPFDAKSSRHGVMQTAIHMDTDSAWFEELWSMREELIDKPLALIWGTQDPALGEHALNRIWHEFPLADVETIPDSGRMLTEEHPDMVADALRRFALARCRSDAQAI